MQYQSRGFRSAVILCEDKIEIKENSWAQEGLLQKGEKLAPLSKEDLELIECTRELYDNPSPKVKRMADEVLSLNVLEVNQLLQLIQVRLCVVAILFMLSSNMLCIICFCLYQEPNWCTSIVDGFHRRGWRCGRRWCWACGGGRGGEGEGHIRLEAHRSGRQGED
jgi:hypothetical protein